MKRKDEKILEVVLSCRCDECYEGCEGDSKRRKGSVRRETEVESKVEDFMFCFPFASNYEKKNYINNARGEGIIKMEEKGCGEESRNV